MTIESAHRMRICDIFISLEPDRDFFTVDFMIDDLFKLSLPLYFSDGSILFFMPTVILVEYLYIIRFVTKEISRYR